MSYRDYYDEDWADYDYGYHQKPDSYYEALEKTNA